MYIGRWVYNPLSIIVRRVKEVVKRIESVMALILVTIPIGFGLVIWGVQQNNWCIKILLSVIGLGLLGFSAWEYKRMQSKIDKQEEKQAGEREKRHEELLAALSGTKEAFKKALKEDREQRNKETNK